MADCNPTVPHLNPAAGAFVPTNGNQVSPISLLELQYKVEDLEREQAWLRAEGSDHKTLINTLRIEIDMLKKGDWGVTVGPFQDQLHSRLTEARDASKYGVDGSPKPNDACIPPHLRKASNTSYVPPHLRVKTGSGFVAVAPDQHGGVANGISGKSSEPTQADDSNANNSLITDSKVDDHDTKHLRQKTAIEREPTPPPSPKTTEAQMSSAIQHLSTRGTPKDYKPVYIANLPALASSILSKIPPAEDTTTFSSDFLRNQLGGSLWDYNLVFIPPDQTSMLHNRVYYLVDPVYDAYVPASPGQHGAKLVPFFNAAPEDNLAFDLPDDYDSSSNVPLFVLREGSGGRKRYVYYGHYSQTRWSDKLDYDRMVEVVPRAVREHWAEELAASGRPEWVTRALRDYFFPAPAYTGALPAAVEHEGGSVAEEEMGAREDKVARDVSRHVQKLKMWKKEADMRTSLIKKDFILEAFEQADADEPKALRFWWEYLECVDWRPDFYNTLVALQSRNANYA